MKALMDTIPNSPKKPSDLQGAFLGPVETRLSSQDDVLVLATYDLAHFEVGLFEQYGVPTEPTLTKAVAKRQAEYLAARVLARTAITALGREAALPIKAPTGAPIWPTGLHGSISHAHGTVGVWLTQAPVSVGLDIETLATANQCKAIQRVVLTDNERTLGLDARALTAVFSAKEAIYKALHPVVGHRFGFDCADLIAPPTEELATLRLTKTLCPDCPKGTVLPVMLRWTGAQVLTQCKFALQ
jgi:enterobactin synthetase component D